MLLTSNDEIRVYEKSIHAGRNYLHLYLLPSGEMAAGKFKSKMYILYDSGCWYASKIYSRSGSKAFPCPPQKIALVDRESCIIYRNEEQAAYYSKTSDLPEDARFYCFVYTGKVIEVVIADSSRSKTVLRATLAPNAGICMIIVMSFLALIREFDPETADAIERFWNRSPQKEGKKNIFEHNNTGTEVGEPKPEN